MLKKKKKWQNSKTDNAPNIWNIKTWETWEVLDGYSVIIEEVLFPQLVTALMHDSSFQCHIPQRPAAHDASFLAGSLAGSR